MLTYEFNKPLIVSWLLAVLAREFHHLVFILIVYWGQTASCDQMSSLSFTMVSQTHTGL